MAHGISLDRSRVTVIGASLKISDPEAGASASFVRVSPRREGAYAEKVSTVTVELRGDAVFGMRVQVVSVRALVTTSTARACGPKVAMERRLSRR